MDFNDTPEEAAFREEVQNWLASNCIPESELEGLNIVERGRLWIKRKSESNWSCIQWPKQYGGRGATAMQRVIWEQEESKYPHLKNNRFMVGQSMAGPTLMKYLKDEPETLQHLLPPIVSGEHLWVQLFSEPAGGSDLAALRTKAERDGNNWIVNGQKIWSSLAVDAEWGILVARTDPTLPKHKGLTYFYLNMNTPGIEIRPIKQLTGESEFNEVFFTDVRIPDSQRVGAIGQGWEVALTTLSNERLALSGEDEDVNFDNMFELASTAYINGKPAIEDSLVKAKLADWYCIEAGLRATNYRAISALSQGRDPGPENSINKMVAGQNAQDIASFGIDLLEQTGIAYDGTSNSFAAHALLRIPGDRVAGGTDEIQANIIAERVLGLPPEQRTDKNIPFNEIKGGI